MAATKRCAPPPPPPPPPPPADTQPHRVHASRSPHSHEHVRADNDRAASHEMAARQPHQNRHQHRQQARDPNRSQQRPHDVHRAATPPPPPPPPSEIVANNNSSKFDFGRSFSHDSSAVRSDAEETGGESFLSPNLTSFLNTNADIVRAKSLGLEPNDGGRNRADRDLSPIDVDASVDEGEVTILHSIFSPKFHARSARKRAVNHGRRRPCNGGDGGNHHFALFSPGSAASARCDASSAVSEMSDDDFGSINAILRGDAIEDIKRSFGLDRDHHPLSSGRRGDLKVLAENAEEANVSDPDVDAMGSGVYGGSNTGAPGGESVADDSTAAMLEKARTLTGKKLHIGNQGGRTPAPTVQLHEHTFASPENTGHRFANTSRTEQTPKVTPTSEEKFYTPASEYAPLRDDAARSTPVALAFDVAGGMSGGKTLPPVSEEEETKTTTKGYWDAFRTNDGGGSAEGETRMTDFCTPKQHDGKDWKLDDFDDSDYEDDGDEEEFFSPLAQHAIHTPASKRKFDAGEGSNFDRFDQSTLGSSPLDFEADPPILINANSFEQLSVSQSVVPRPNIPVATEAPAKTRAASPREHSEPERESGPPSTEPSKGPTPLRPETMQGAQQRTSSAAPPLPSEHFVPDATPPSKASFLAHHHSGAVAQSPSFHLHSPSVSSLPPEALTVDFVRHCDCIDTLEAILSLLSDDNKNTHRNNHSKSRGKQHLTRYPKLALLVEKRLQKMKADMEQVPEEHKAKPMLDEQESVQFQPKIASTGENKAPARRPSMEGSDKENVQPHKIEHQSADEIAQEAPRPMDSIMVLHDSKEGILHAEGCAKPPVSPDFSATISHSSLDMNLSESMFALDDESHFWKQGLENDIRDGNEGDKEQHRSLVAEKNTTEERNSQHKASQTEEAAGCDIPLRYAELKEKLASSLASNARLTGEVDSLVSNHEVATKKLSSQLEHVTEQLSQLKVTAATEKDAQQKHIAKLETINNDLRQQVWSFQDELRRFNEKSERATHSLKSEVEDARIHSTSLSQDKETLGRELNEIRSRYNQAQKEVAKLKLLLKKRNATPESESMHRVAESAKLANQALANALAISEKDLAEANEAKESSARECNTLRIRATKLEDKSAFLSAKVKDMKKELDSSRIYIDQLYEDLQAKSNHRSSPSKEIKADFERKELEWMELERGYSKRIQKLEDKLGGSPDKPKSEVSMDTYLLEVKQTRQYKMESLRNEQTVKDLKATVGDLRGQLDAMQKSSVKKNNGGGKSLRMLQYIESKQARVPEGNDENAAPSNAMEQQHPASESIGLRAVKQQQQLGKQLSRVAAIKAAGGRKGLSEQLKRARRFG